MFTVLAITVMLALNALYVAAEFATVGARKHRIQAMARDGNGSASQLLHIVSDPVRLTTTSPPVKSPDREIDKDAKRAVA